MFKLIICILYDLIEEMPTLAVSDSPIAYLLPVQIFLF